MIKFNRTGSQLSVEIKVGIDSFSYTLEMQCSNQLHAILLQRQLENNLNNILSQIREKEYNRGWKDAKSKKVPKKTWFSGWWS